MKVLPPITVTDDMIIDANVFETAPAAYDAGTTYALDAYASVVGAALGEILIYKSLQASNTGHTPDSSPTWWVYSSSTYEEYSATKFYALGHRVLNPTTHKVMQSLVPSNVSRPIDGGVAWMSIGKTTLTLPAAYNHATTYDSGTLVKRMFAIGSDFENEEGYSISSIVTSVFVYVSKVGSNTANYPESSPTQWEFLKSYPVPYETTGNYMLGYVVQDTDGNMYQSLKDDNYNTPLIAPIAWQEVAPANKYAAFDTQISTQTVANKELTYTIATGIIEAVAVVNGVGSTVTVIVRDGLAGPIVFEQTKALSGDIVTDWYEYFFTDPTIQRTQVLFTGVPPYASSHVTITINGTAEVAAGDIMFGRWKDVGLTGFGVQAGITDFSTITEDTFGQTTFVPRANKQWLSSRDWIEVSNFNRAFNLLRRLPATPCLWLAADSTEYSEALMLKAYYKDFTMDIAGPVEAYCTLKLIGLT